MHRENSSCTSDRSFLNTGKKRMQGRNGFLHWQEWGSMHRYLIKKVLCDTDLQLVYLLIFQIKKNNTTFCLLELKHLGKTVTVNYEMLLVIIRINSWMWINSWCSSSFSYLHHNLEEWFSVIILRFCALVCKKVQYRSSDISKETAHLEYIIRSVSICGFISFISLENYTASGGIHMEHKFKTTRILTFNKYWTHKHSHRTLYT